MPGRTLPTILSSDVASQNTPQSCYVTLGTKVYDITPFLKDHPGGGDLILKYGGKDVTQILGDEISHSHSDAAYEILEDYLKGFVAADPVMKSVINSQQLDSIVSVPLDEAGAAATQEQGAADSLEPQIVHRSTGMSSAADLERETDARSDYRTHKFLNLEKPLLMQVWRGGFSREFYLEQVHRPRHYKGGDSAPLFGNFLEPLTKTPWYAVPAIWLPWVLYGTALGCQHMPSPFQTAAYFLTGLALWTLVEYGLHRGLFHVDK